MKKIKKIGGLITIFLFNIYNTCFADALMLGESSEGHGMQRIIFARQQRMNNILIGILILVIVVCTVIIIRRIIKKKKEKSNDNK